MNSKVQTFAQLATNTSGQLTSSYAEWTHFLETAARLYKYPYHEQVLIYAQRPEATACASYDVWSKRMGRGVRRGSKGIGLLSANGVRYVFDISDTVGRDGSRKPYLWEYRKEHAEAVVAALAEQYGVTDEGGLPYQLEAIAQELAGEYWEQNWEDILASVPGSFLEDYDELNVEVEFRNAVTVSTTYALMSRCGLNPSEFFTHENFLPVFDFNTPDSITALGTAVSGNSEQVLRQIEVTIKNYERTRRVERSGLYGKQPDLPAGGELPSARIRGGNTIDFGEIRTDEGAVSEGGTPGAVQPADTQRETDGSPDGDRSDGEPEAGAADAPAEGEYGPDGTDESERPLEVGGADEQREGEGGGDGTGRADLPVTSPSAIDFTAVGPTGLQYSHRELNSTAIPYFEDISEKRELLRKSDALKKRQVEVAEYFAAHTPPDERVQFVKSLFNNTFTEIILDSGQRVGYRAYEDCLHLWRGPYTDREQEEFLSWEDVSSAIEGLMQDGLWAEPMEQLTLEIGAPEKVTQDEDYIPNLFDLAGSTIPLTNEPVESSATVQPGLSQNVIDAALTLGANDSDSRLRIVAEFMKDKPLAENVRFLQAHYKENGAGFYVGERKYSLWYNEAGMQIAPGESALTFTAIALTWEQAAERIRVLLDEGRYASQSMLYRAWPFEKNRVAEALEYLHRDIDDEHKDKYLPTLTAALSGTFGYPDVVDKTKELLEQPEQLKRVIDDFALFQRDYAHNRDILRFHFHRPDEIMQGLQDLQCTPLKFTASPDFMPVERFFISQDEIDRLLRQGNGHGDYRITVFTFFEQHPDRKEREKYLSSLHGVYSGYHGGNDNITYTTKELTFTHGDIIEPYAAVKMKWSQVRKRIEELIKKDAFLSPEDREIMESRALETPSEKIDPFETAKSLIRKFRQSDRDSLDFSDLSKVLLTNAITENEKHGIDVFADLDNFRLLFEVNGQTVSTLQFHDVNDLNDHLEKLSAAELIEFAKEQFVINLNNEAPPKISEQDAKKHDILMANTRAHFASYEEVKQAHPGDIVLFQRGDFFEMYGPDARVASVELDIHLLNRNIPELGRVAMCGITAGSLEKSLEILRKKYGVTVSALPEKGTERQTYSLPSFDSELDTAKKRIQDFCQQEYGSDADFSDLEHVSLAYTTTGNSEQEIQVEADLVHFVLTKYLDGQVCDEYHYNSLRELTEAELSGMNFDGLVTLETDDAAEITATPDSQSTQILDSTFNYRRLSQMKADCDYFLGAGNRAEKHLWHGNIHEHIGEMRRIYGLLPEKPEWLTTEEIDSYAQRMARRYQVVVYHTIVNGFDEMPEYQTLQQAQQIARDYVSGKMDEDGFQYEGAAVWDVQEHQWLFVEGYFPVLEGDKELPYLPYKPDEDPKQSHPEQAPTVRELYEHYKEILWGKLMENEAFQKACINSDRQNAIDEGHNAVERAAKDLGIAQGDMQFYQLYFGNTPFHNQLKEELANEGYDAYMALSADLPPWGVEVGNHSPWGTVQTTQELADGVFKVSTASHGGIMAREPVAKERISPELLARGGEENGWCFFEEDELAPLVEAELQGHRIRQEQPQVTADTSVPTRDPLAPAYSVGDTVYLDNTAFTITEVGLFNVHLQDPAMTYPVFRAESKENFEKLLRRDERNSSITDFFTYTSIGPMDDCGDLRDALTGEGGLLDEQGKAEISQWLRRGEGNAAIAQHLQDKFDRTTESMTLETGETADYSVNGPTFVLNLLDKSHTVRMYDLRTVAGVLRAMYQQELGGFRHDEPLQEPPNVEVAPAPVQPEITVPPSTEPSDKPSFSTKTVAVYPAEKNNLPFDVVIETLHIDEPQRGPTPQNFHITDDNLGAGGAKAKFRRNIEAVTLLHELEFDGRQATPEEQETLSKYVGWGALADAFDETKTNWADEYKELYVVLSPEEYESARASTLNAHYTSPTVIKAIYQALENMGFKGGNILEPSMGVGNFFGLLPESMASSKLYGVELDGLTGRIAKQLYPHAHIEIKGYENTNFQNNSFDIAIGNVPFGQYQVFDPAYNKLGFSIHNYFFAKTIDKVRPGGIIAFVTSRYTMDSKSTQAREYMAQRAELLGAIRLPNNAFLSNAGTEVVTDILFLQKREQPVTTMSEWLFTEENADGFTINSYFIEHPEMILGEQSSTSTQYGGQDFTVNPFPSADLGELLSEAISHIDGHYVEAETVQIEDEKEQEAIPADPAVKNFSYTIIKGDVYYRQDSVMVKMELGATAKARTMALIDLRNCTQRLIAEQMELSAKDEDIISTQAELNRLYDNFSRKFGLINDKTNERAFSQDSSYYLLCALEILDDEGKFIRKSDMFTKRTIYPRQEITHVDTATEALAVSIGERARVDIPFMASLTGKTEDEIISDLQGQIYRVPLKEPPVYQPADEYLSGNVREKLKVAEAAATTDPNYNINVSALEAVQPKDLDASEISVRLGATWIEQEYVEQFMYEVLKTPVYAHKYVNVRYSPQINLWNISNKSSILKNDVTAYTTYGTSRVSAYKLLEDALNLQNTQVYDTITDSNGNDKRVFNAKETTLAQQKQAMIKQVFQDWIWKDPDRRQKLVRKYNDEMNCIRPRQYDGSYLVLAGMNPEIQLEEHQKNAIARAVYGGNTLFAHCVGAGKTFEITASAMEMKRLGLCSKSMIVVPNHLTQQWASEFLRLYPNANILVTTKRDFEKDRRKKFCSRIATGDYDAVIIGYSQFEKIPVSKERQMDLLHQQISDIMVSISLAKAEDGQRFTIKQMERTKKGLEARLEKLQADHRKDDVINFEELGIDRLFVDEADNFKNLFLATKMRNVAGLSTSEAQKSTDLFNKTQYLDEITEYKGVIFATGTPISNSITEMFTMQRYLQNNALKAMGMGFFDSWASRFGETTTTMELAPEGTGYRLRTRFAKFFNLPELMNIFHEVADIKTEDMLNLPTPDVEFHNIVAKPTEFQKAYVQELSERATAVRVGDVEPYEDNMLKITNDGRKLGLDQRLISPLAEDNPASKLNLCVDNIMQFWEDGKDDKLTQLVFSDLSTPKKDGNFNVYDDIKRKLMERGVPETEVAFIHDAETEVKKKELFAKVRSGKVRVLIGSTQKLGAGTNVQDRLIALHHLDCPWRPRDLTQREGRIIRRGNKNPLVHVFRYATEGTFDSYLWQAVEKKQQFIGQIMTSKSPARTCEDVDEAALSYAEVKALCAGDPRIKERMELDVEVAKLQVMQANHRSQQYDLEDKIRLYFPQERQRLEWRIEGIQMDIATLAEHPLPTEGYIGIELLGQFFKERKPAGVVLLDECKKVKVYTTAPVGKYRGLEVLVKRQNLLSEPQVILKGAIEYAFTASDSDIGNITHIDNALERLPEELAKAEASFENVKQQFESAKQEIGKPFPQEQELKDKLARITELDIELKMNEGSKQPAKFLSREKPEKR